MAKKPAFKPGLQTSKAPAPITYRGKPQKAGLGNGSLNGGLIGAGPAAPAAAPAAAPPSPAGTPDDAAYESQQNALQTRLNNTNLGLAGQEQQIKQSYGFDPEYASNPYTKANMLAHAASQRFNATTNSQAAHGQLYAGSTSNARAFDQFNADASMNDARNSYAQALSDIQNKRLGAQSDYAVDSADAFSSLLGRLTASTPDPSLQSAPSYPSDYPTYAPKAPKPKPKPKPKKK